MLQVLVDSDDYTAFMKELLGVTEDLIRGRDPVDPRTYRKPYVPELGTWNEAALTREIRAHRSLARTRLENNTMKEIDVRLLCRSATALALEKPTS